MELARTAKAVIRAVTAMLVLALLTLTGSLAQDAAEQEVASEQSADSPPAEKPAPAPAPSDEDPFDYEATEQISEDLPVSFPVDI